MREDDCGRDGFRHLSGQVRCPQRDALAIISAVERCRGSRSSRSVVWCSLRGDAQWCAENCGAPIVAAADAASAAD